MRTLFLLFLALATWSCAESDSTDTSSEMADFAADTSFQDEHELPDSLAYTAQGEQVSFPCADGTEGKAYVVRTQADDAPVLLMLHEWWGLNDHIRKEADRLAADLGVTIWALDLYDGAVAADRETASRLMQSREDSRMSAIVEGALAQIPEDVKIGTIGWCFGGEWSLRSAIQAGKRAQACVMYYGMPVQKADELVALQAPVLGLFAEKDAWIDQSVVDNFSALCAATGKSFTARSYPADHAFANPSSPRYDSEAAQAANREARAFLRRYLQ